MKYPYLSFLNCYAYNIKDKKTCVEGNFNDTVKLMNLTELFIIWYSE